MSVDQFSDTTDAVYTVYFGDTGEHRGFGFYAAPTLTSKICTKPRAT
jgi:hypothetical protein